MSQLDHNIDHNDMTEKVKQYQLQNAQAEHFIRSKKRIMQQIRAEMEANGTETMRAGDYTVRAVTSVRRHFDIKEFRKDHPDLVAQYTVETDVRRFSVD